MAKERVQNTFCCCCYSCLLVCGRFFLLNTPKVGHWKLRWSSQSDDMSYAFQWNFANLGRPKKSLSSQIFEVKKLRFESFHFNFNQEIVKNSMRKMLNRMKLNVISPIQRWNNVDWFYSLIFALCCVQMRMKTTTTATATTATSHQASTTPRDTSLNITKCQWMDDHTAEKCTSSFGQPHDTIVEAVRQDKTRQE